MKHYITNMPTWTRPIVEEAIGLWPEKCWFIDEDPVQASSNERGYALIRDSIRDYYYSVYKLGDSPYSEDFLMSYQTLLKSERWQMWLRLTDVQESWRQELSKVRAKIEL